MKERIRCEVRRDCMDREEEQVNAAFGRQSCKLVGRIFFPRISTWIIPENSGVSTFSGKSLGTNSTNSGYPYMGFCKPCADHLIRD